MKETLARLKKYPLILLFFGFIALYSLADVLAPDREVSELENRKLAQMPAFNLSAFAGNQWTRDVGTYTEDQFLFRDGWISLQGTLERAQGKLEAGGVWFAKDNYQIAKNNIFTEAQQRTLPLNTEALAELAQRHPGQVTAMVVPSPANILQDKLRYGPAQVDEDTMLDEVFAQAGAAGAKTIDLRPLFRTAETEGAPVYYHTDHHWTLDGARAAYEAFCESQGIEALPPDDSLRRSLPGFWGTNYAKTKRGTPSGGDTLEYYDLPNTLTVHRQQADGSVVEEPGPVMDTDKLDSFDKYGAFLRGNNGYSVLEGDGSGSILVVKDSYGNSFVPYLAANYEKIGIIDLRAWHEVSETFAQGGYEQILVLYSFDNFTTDANAVRLMG